MSKHIANGRREGAPGAPVQNHNVTAPTSDHTPQRADVELGLGSSAHQKPSAPPQTSQIQTTPYASLTGYSRNLGTAYKQDLVLPGRRLVGEDPNLNGLRRHHSGASHSNSNGNSHLYPNQTVEATLPRKDVFRQPRTLSPDNHRRSTLNQVPEEMESTGFVSTQSQAQPRRQHASVDSQRYYGSVGYENPTNGDAVHLGELTFEEDSELSEEEEDWLLDEELAKQGLYRGSYRSLLAIYSLVPLTSLMAFVSLALILVFAFPRQADSPFPYPPYLPYPLPEILTSTALWSLAYLLRDPLYTISLLFTSLIPFPTHRYPAVIPFLTSTLSAILQCASTLLLRQLAVPILLVPYYSTERPAMLQPIHPRGIFHIAHKYHFPTWHDIAFHRVWWIAMGWALAEAIVGIKQGYENIGLYKDVLVDVTKSTSQSGLITETGNPSFGQRERTPSNGQVGDNINVTPTQRNWSSRHGQETATWPGEAGTPSSSAATSQQQKRSPSNSLSSSEINLRQYPGDNLQILGQSGETQPLIGGYSNSNLSRQMTRESDRLMVENEVERDLEELMTLKNREELEEIYGIPVIRIPVFVSCLHRVNSILSSLGTTLLLTSAYMRSTLAYIPPPPDHLLSRSPITFRPSNKSLLLTIPVLLAIHSLLSLMHTLWILPRLGIHTFVYIGLLVSLGLFFGGLGVWEALT